MPKGDPGEKGCETCLILMCKQTYDLFCVNYLSVDYDVIKAEGKDLNIHFNGLIDYVSYLDF